MSKISNVASFILLLCLSISEVHGAAASADADRKPTNSIVARVKSLFLPRGSRSTGSADSVTCSTPLLDDEMLSTATSSGTTFDLSSESIACSAGDGSYEPPKLSLGSDLSELQSADAERNARMMRRGNEVVMIHQVFKQRALDMKESGPYLWATRPTEDLPYFKLHIDIAYNLLNDLKERPHLIVQSATFPQEHKTTQEKYWQEINAILREKLRDQDPITASIIARLVVDVLFAPIIAASPLEVRMLKLRFLGNKEFTNYLWQNTSPGFSTVKDPHFGKALDFLNKNPAFADAVRYNKDGSLWDKSPAEQITYWRTVDGALRKYLRDETLEDASIIARFCVNLLFPPLSILN